MVSKRVWLLGVLLLWCGISMGGQEAPPVTLDADDKLILQLLGTTVRRATADCDALQSKKEATILQQQVETRLKAKHGLSLAQAVALMKP